MRNEMEKYETMHDIEMGLVDMLTTEIIDLGSLKQFESEAIHKARKSYLLGLTDEVVTPAVDERIQNTEARIERLASRNFTTEASRSEFKAKLDKFIEVATNIGMVYGTSIGNTGYIMGLLEIESEERYTELAQFLYKN